MKLVSSKFPSATSALAWLHEQGYSKLPWSEAYAKIVNEVSKKGYKTCLTVLVFPDGSSLPANSAVLDHWVATH